MTPSHALLKSPVSRPATTFITPPITWKAALSCVPKIATTVLATAPMAFNAGIKTGFRTAPISFRAGSRSVLTTSRTPLSAGATAFVQTSARVSKMGTKAVFMGGMILEIPSKSFTNTGRRAVPMAVLALPTPAVTCFHWASNVLAFANALPPTMSALAVMSAVRALKSAEEALMIPASFSDDPPRSSSAANFRSASLLSP